MVRLIKKRIVFLNLNNLKPQSAAFYNIKVIISMESLGLLRNII